jgi:hypothetical protein
MGSPSLPGPFQQPKHSRKLINGNKTDADGADQIKPATWKQITPMITK